MTMIYILFSTKTLIMRYIKLYYK